MAIVAPEGFDFSRGTFLGRKYLIRIFREEYFRIFNFFRGWGIFLAFFFRLLSMPSAIVAWITSILSIAIICLLYSNRQQHLFIKLSGRLVTVSCDGGI